MSERCCGCAMLQTAPPPFTGIPWCESLCRCLAELKRPADCPTRKDLPGPLQHSQPSPPTTAGEALRKLRRFSRMNLREVSRLLGVGVVQLSSWERGKSSLEWDGEICKGCNRRNTLAWSVSDEVWMTVVGDAGKVLCVTCFDEAAQRKGVQYELDDEPKHLSWSDFERGKS